MKPNEPTTLSDVKRHHDVMIPVETETVAATRYEPVDVDGPAPALLMYVPYHKDDLITYGAYDPLNEYLAHHGYEVVVADMVGTGASTGYIDEPFTRREGKEPAAIIEWLAAQVWTTGDIGMYGKSYGGITALDAAGQRPDPLKAIVPIHTPYLGYRNAYRYGGTFELLTIGMDWLTLMQALDVKPPSRRDTDGRWADVWKDRLEKSRERTPWLFQFLDHEYKGEYWADKDIPVENIDVPTLAVGGWRDPYTRDTLEYFRAIDAPKRLLLGPWRHQMPHRGRESAIDFRAQVVEWFDHFLKGEETGTLDRPKISAWTEVDGGGKVGGGVWRGFESWPDIENDAATLTFVLTSDGLSSEDEYDGGSVKRSYEFDHTVGLLSTSPYNAEIAPADTNQDDVRSLVFETEPLAAPVELTGTGTVNVRLRPSTPDPVVSVRVMDVDPDGSATLVTRGTVRARCRDGLEEPTELEVGREHEFDVPLEPKSHVFETGHRLRVAIGAGFFPDNLPSREHGSFTVLSTPGNASTLRFPGQRRTDLQFDDTIEMDPPDKRVPTTPERVHSADSTWETSREHTDGRATARKSHRFTVDLPHADLSRAATFEVTVEEDDPTTAVAENEMEITIDYGSERVCVTATNRFSRDFSELTSEVTLDGRLVFAETWIR